LPALDVPRIRKLSHKQVTPSIIRFGIDLHQTRSVGFYDAIVLATAVTAGCGVLLSEDMNSGEVVNGVRIANPFDYQ